jgi:hypothetical protein
MVRGRVKKPKKDLGPEGLKDGPEKAARSFPDFPKALFNIGRIGVKQSGWADLHRPSGGKSCRRAEKEAVSGLSQRTHQSLKYLILLYITQ